jgi:hypothetical protein
VGAEVLRCCSQLYWLRKRVAEASGEALRRLESSRRWERDNRHRRTLVELASEVQGEERDEEEGATAVHLVRGVGQLGQHMMSVGKPRAPTEWEDPLWVL